MNDRELLELAAKAASYHYAWLTHSDGPDTLRVSFFGMKADPYAKFDAMDWNPLTDDVDAIRLAVKLGLILETGLDSGQTTSAYDIDHDHFAEVDVQEFDGDACRALRKAIVLVAAEIGKAMQEQAQ